MQLLKHKYIHVSENHSHNTIDLQLTDEVALSLPVSPNIAVQVYVPVFVTVRNEASLRRLPAPSVHRYPVSVSSGKRSMLVGQVSVRAREDPEGKHTSQPALTETVDLRSSR